MAWLIHIPVALCRYGCEPSPEYCHLALPRRLLRWFLATAKGTNATDRHLGVHVRTTTFVTPGWIAYRRAATDKSTLVRLYLFWLHSKPIS